MSKYIDSVLKNLQTRNASQPEFLQAAEEILKTPLEKFGDKEVEDLAKKYENQEKP